MNITGFITAYAQYLPNDEIVLLKAANEFYKSLITSDSKYESYPEELQIIVEPGAKGESFGSLLGGYTIKYPSGSDGFKMVPVAGIGGFENSTFMIYDSAMAYSHELGHVILSVLGISATNGPHVELMIAALASITAEKKAEIPNFNEADPAHLKLLAQKVRQYFGLSGYEVYEENLRTVPIDAKRSDLLSKARSARGSFENVYNFGRDDGKGFYAASGLEKAPPKYRVGYVSHTNTGIPPGDPLDKEWITYTTISGGGGNEGAADPGRMENLVANKIGIAWLGNNNDNTMRIDALKDAQGNPIDKGGNDYIDGGDGNDTIGGGKGIDILIGGAGNDTLDGGDESDRLKGGLDNDKLYGGKGDDTYLYRAGDGDDIIDDEDWRGRIIYEDLGGVRRLLDVGVKVPNEQNRYESPDGLVNYTYDQANKELVIRFKRRTASGTLVDIAGSITLKNLPDPGRLNTGHPVEIGVGIFLVEPDGAYVPTNTKKTTSGYQVTGDYAPVPNPLAQGAIGVDPYLYDELGNVVVDAFQPVAHADTLRGSDPIDPNNPIGADDVLYGGLAGDRLNGLGGNDVLEGGEDSDVLYGGKGDDVLYAEYAVDMDLIDGDTPAITQRNWGEPPSPALLPQYQSGNQAGIGIKGDWLAGGDGNDDLIGSAGNDVLSGGQGQDDLVGGAGNDILLGDADVVAQFKFWYATPDANGLYLYGAIGDSDPLAGDADTIDAGSGDDIVLAGAGNDFVDGGAGNDRIAGEAGDDVLDGGDGNDVIYGDSGVEAGLRIEVGSGLDNGWGQWNGFNFGAEGARPPNVYVDGNDTLIGGAGQDTLYGQGGDDTLEGDEGNDYLSGGAGNDALSGGLGADELLGGDGADTLSGGEGSDFLEGEEGSDTYVFARGDGADYIRETNATGNDVNVLQFDDISANEVFSKRVGDALQIVVRDSNDSVTILNWFTDPGARIQATQFANGAVLDVGQLEVKKLPPIEGSEAGDVLYGSQYPDEIFGYGGDDTLYGFEDGDVLDGGDGSDILYGYQGDDTLIGGAGNNDVLYGGQGSDTYHFGWGSGQDYIHDSEYDIGRGLFQPYYVTNNDVVRLGPNITSADVTVTRENNTLRIHLNGSDDVLSIDGAYADAFRIWRWWDWVTPGNFYHVEQIEFSDGTVWDTAMFQNLPNLLYGTADTDYLQGVGQVGDGELNVHNMLYGYGGDDVLHGGRDSDVLEGGTGDDAIFGQGGDDVYVFNVGDGFDTVTAGPGLDTARFGAGIAAADIVLTETAWQYSEYRDINGDTKIVLNNDLIVGNRVTSDGVRTTQLWELDPLTGAIEGVSTIDTLEFADGTVTDKLKGSASNMFWRNGHAPSAQAFFSGIPQTPVLAQRN